MDAPLASDACPSCLSLTYNSGGELTSAATSGPAVDQPNVTLSYTYDPSGNVTELSDNLSSAGLTSLTYDADERVTGIETTYGGTAGPYISIEYDSGGRITSESRSVGGSGTSVSTSFSYDAANRQTTITDQSVTSGTPTALATYVYSYDQADRVTTMVDAEGTYTYAYDNANQETNVDENGTNVESYTYDSNGNRTGTGYSTGTDNEQTASPGYTYTYDNAGNLISETDTSTSVVTTYTYDYRNRLTEVTQGGTVIATYTYDAMNNRIGIDDAGTRTWTVYNGTQPYADFNGSGSLTERYVSGPGVVDGAPVDELLARTSAGGATAWYLTDKLGSVRDIVSSSGTELDHIVYDSFGNIVSETNAADGDRFKFAGMEFDATTGEYYDRARYYDPTSGRFLVQDPSGFGALDGDLYRYVWNSPLDATDPTGRSPSEPDTLNSQAGAEQQQNKQPKPAEIWLAYIKAQKELDRSQNLYLEYRARYQAAHPQIELEWEAEGGGIPHGLEIKIKAQVSIPFGGKRDPRPVPTKQDMRNYYDRVMNLYKILKDFQPFMPASIPLPWGPHELDPVV